MKTRTFIYRYLYTLFVLFIPLSTYCNAEDTTGAEAVVEELHDALLTVMKNGDTQGFLERYNVLEPVINSNFDTPLIAKVVTSRYWDKLTDAQQKDFINQFKKLSVSTYASRFDSFAGEQFRTLSTEILKKGRVLVKTEIISPNDSPVRLDYLMHNVEGRWYIISVIADGVNDLSLKRTEYASVIKESGFDTLVAKINEKIQNMEKPTTN